MSEVENIVELKGRTAAEGSDIPVATRDQVESEQVDQVESEQEVLESDVIEETPRPLDPRLEIARKYDERRLAEKVDSHNEIVEEEVVEEPITPAENLQKDDNSNKITVKVNGREIEVDRSKVEAAGGLELYQKQVSVNDGFVQLAAERKQMQAERDQMIAEREQMVAEAAERRVEPPVPTQNLPSEDDAERRDKIREGVRKYREALLDSDDVSADQALLDLLASQAPATVVQPELPAKVDVDAIRQQAAVQAAELVRMDTAQQRMQEETDAFISANPEVLSDPMLYQAVDSMSLTVEEENPNWTTSQVLSESLTRVSAWRNPQVPSPAVTQDKIAEKRAIKTPGGQSTVRSQAPAVKKAQTKAEYVQSVRRARGLGTT